MLWVGMGNPRASGSSVNADVTKGETPSWCCWSFEPAGDWTPEVEFKDEPRLGGRRAFLKDPVGLAVSKSWANEMMADELEPLR